MISPLAMTIDDIDIAANEFLKPQIFDIPFESITTTDNLCVIGTKIGEIKLIDLETKRESLIEKVAEKEIAVNDENVEEIWLDAKCLSFMWNSDFEYVNGKHSAGISCLKTSANHRYLASGTYDGTVKYWNLLNESWISSVDLYSSVLTLDISCNNQFIAAGTADASVYIWALDSNQLTFLQGHTDKVKLVKITENSKFIISNSDDGTCRLWSVQTKSLVKAITEIEFISFFQTTSDSKTAVVIVNFTSLYLWGIEDSKLEFKENNSGQISCLNITKDDKWIITGSSDSIIRVWSISDPDEKFNLEGHEDDITCMDTTSDSKYLISASTDSTVRVWDLNTKRHIYSLEGNNAQHKFLKITANNRFIICGSYDYFIRIWRTEERSKETVFSGHEGEVRHLQITNDDRFIFSAGSTDNTIMIWNSEKHKKIAYLSCHEREVTALSLSPDSEILISASSEDKLQIWRLNNMKLWGTTRKIEIKVHLLQIASDNFHIVSASLDNKVRIWNVVEPDYEIVLSGHADTITALLITKDCQKIITASRDYTLRVWSIEASWEISVLIGHEDHVTCLQLSKDNNFAISGGDDNNIIIWSLFTFELVTVLKGHKNEVKCLQLTRDQKFIVSGSNDKTIRIWDFYDRRQIAVLKGHEKRVRCIEITNDSKYIVSGSDDCTVRVWNIKERRQERVLKGHELAICCIKIASNDKFFVTSSKDKTVRVWKIDEVVIRKQNALSKKNLLKVYGYDSGISNHIFMKKLINRVVPETAMIAAEIGPMKINLLHYYCFYDLADLLRKAQDLGAAMFRDNFNRSPLYYAIERQSRECLDHLLNNIINCKIQDVLEQSMHALRDDIIKLLDAHSPQVLPFLESAFRKMDSKDFIFLATPRRKLPITIFSPTILPQIEDFVFDKDYSGSNRKFLVQIWTSSLNWNFQNGSRDSIKFLRAIHKCPIIEIYTTAFIQSVIRMKWDSFKKFNAILTAIYALNIAFLTWILGMNGDVDIGLFIAFWIVNFLLLVYEFLQLYSSKRFYFLSSLNYLDISRLILSYVWSIIGATGNFYEVLSFFTVMTNFLRGLVYFRTFDKTRFYVRLIIKAAFDTLTFLLILLYSTFGFAVLYIASSSKLDLRSAWKLSFELDMGAFNNDGANWIEYWIFSLASIINVILMLNLLISILGKSFDDFQQSQESMDYKEMLDVIIEFESLMYWARKTGKRTYLQKCDYFKQRREKKEDRLKYSEEIESLKTSLSEFQNNSEKAINEKFDLINKRLGSLEKQMNSQEGKIDVILEALKPKN
ncbi:unnamed protein product [Blepharisma stoltei]|uniref:Ion transport domain-containing protein n=1 Tax=Blepharisma stoltei TaxID=1481888 RepID=A0AAU9JA32_9CILI|nr:unnamed protein product [Blepharisma stoltei]